MKHNLSSSFELAAVFKFLCVLSACARTSQPDPTAIAREYGERVRAAPVAAPAAESPGKRYTVERTFLSVNGEPLSLHLPNGRRAPLPSVLVLHSALGRTPSVMDACDRLAILGFAAVAADFYRGEVPASLEDSFALRDAANLRGPELAEMVRQAYEAMQSDPRLVSNERFLLGWSYGAAWATVASTFLPDLRGVVAYYGEAFGDNPQLAAKLRAPVLFVGAQRDVDPSPEQLQSITAALRSKGKTVELVLIPAHHGFADRDHPNYEPDAAATAWSKVVRFLEHPPR